MHPVLFRWGEAALQTYSLMISVAYFVALGVWIFLARKRELLKAEAQINISLIACAAGWVGARGLFVAVEWEHFASGEFHLWHLWEGGVVFLGGFVTGGLTFWALLRRFGLPGKLSLETAAPALCFAHAVGRLGCFANGCCHGSVCHLPWAVTYTDPLSAAPLLTPLHPTQLYEALGLVLLGLWLARKVLRAPKTRPEVVPTYLLGYGILRFVVEFFRGDTLRGAWLGLSTSQWIALMMILTALWLDFQRARDHNLGHES